MPKQITAEQRTPEWYEARLGKATASRFGDIMAKTRSGYSASRKNYIADLVVERLTREVPVNFVSTAMQWGIDNEPVALLNYTLQTGNEAEETSLWLHDSLDAGASPDGLVGEDGLVEIKCPNSATHIDTLISRKLPRQYEAQVQGQMWITGRKWCDFVSFDPRMPENAQLFITRVNRDEIFITELEGEVIDFLEEVTDKVEFLQQYK